MNIDARCIPSDYDNCINHLAANHKGWFEFRVCPNNNIHKEATHECLDRYLLPLADGSGTRLPVYYGQEFFNVKLRLPRGLTCEQCVIQWKYNTGKIICLPSTLLDVCHIFSFYGYWLWSPLFDKRISDIPKRYRICVYHIFHRKITFWKSRNRFIYSVIGYKNIFIPGWESIDDRWIHIAKDQQC